MMTKQDLKKEYFNWMYGLVCSDKRFRKTSYKKLLKYLHSVEFSYIICMDGVSDMKTVFPIMKLPTVWTTVLAVFWK